MFRSYSWMLLIGTALLTFDSLPAQAADAPGRPLLQGLFTDNMVMQRGIVDPIWGWTKPGETVTVKFHGQTATAIADADGKWMAKVGPFDAGGPFDLTVSTNAQQRKLSNVMVGDVWICSGQSNMRHGVNSAQNFEAEAAAANHPMIRFFNVPQQLGDSPMQIMDHPPTWEVCTPESVVYFSAAGYFFGRDLQPKVNIPIGLLETAWGGTVCESWTSAQALEKQMPDFKDALAEESQRSAPDFAQSITNWYQHNDPGTQANWQRPDIDISDWQHVTVPTPAHDRSPVAAFKGVIWFRIDLTIPEAARNEKLTVSLGHTRDQTTVWANGKLIGSAMRPPAEESLDLTSAIAPDGKVAIVCRALDIPGGEKFFGRPEFFCVRPRDSRKPIVLSLPTDWLYKESAKLESLPPPPAAPMAGDPNVVTRLYNGMVNPLIPFGIKGAVWYQGESNADRASQYRRLLPTMIRDWRSRFGVGDFPFYIVQLANFGKADSAPVSHSDWAELREAQTLTANTVGNSAIASAIDIGDAHDIHPKNKQEVGRRLALDALALTYGQKIEYSGPTFSAIEFKDDTAIVHFAHAHGLHAQNGPLKGFAVSADGEHFVWADATVDGETVVLKAPSLPKFQIVRYDWANNPEGNLYNDANLPADTFRTDMPK